MDNWREMLTELLQDDNDVLSDWECEFITSVDNQSDRRGSEWCPSQKQLDIIERIWGKVFSA